MLLPSMTYDVPAFVSFSSTLFLPSTLILSLCSLLPLLVEGNFPTHLLPKATSSVDLIEGPALISVVSMTEYVRVKLLWEKTSGSKAALKDGA